jgi:hypothetical protein
MVMRLSDILLRLCGVRQWKPSPHYAECRRLAEQRLGDLSLQGETEMDGRWPVPGAPFDEPQQEVRRCAVR